MVRLRSRLHDVRRRLEILEGQMQSDMRRDLRGRLAGIREEVLRALVDQKSIADRAIVLPCELGCQGR